MIIPFDGLHGKTTSRHLNDDKSIRAIQSAMAHLQMNETASGATSPTQPQHLPQRGKTFSDLPVELHGPILLECMANSERWTILRLQELASVCRLWRDIIKATPEFWTVIDSKTLLSTRLARSRNLPLDIRLTFLHSTPATKRFLKRLSNSAHRWRSLIFVGDVASLQSLATRLEKQLPLLEHLELDYFTDNTSWDAKVLLSGVTRLRFLSLTKVSLNDLEDGIPHFPELRTLHLLDLTTVGAPKDAVRAILRGSKELEELVLVDIEDPDDSDDEDESEEESDSDSDDSSGSDSDANNGNSAPILLPNLTRLVLHDVSETLSLPLLRNFSAPSLLSIRYEAGDPTDDDDCEYEELLTETDLPTLMSTVFTNNVSRDVCIEYGPGTIHFTGADLCVLHLGNVKDQSDLMTCLLRSFPLADFHVEAHFDAKARELDDMLRILGRREPQPPLKRISVHRGNITDYWQICGALGTTMVDYSENLVEWWAADQLEELHFVDAVKDDDVLALEKMVALMLSNRHSAMDNRASGGPTPLRRMVVYYDGDQIYSGINASSSGEASSSISI